MIKWFKKKPVEPIREPEPEEGALRIRQTDENEFRLERYWSSWTNYSGHRTPGHWSDFWDTEYFNYRNYQAWTNNGVNQGKKPVTEFPTMEATVAFYEEVLKSRAKAKEDLLTREAKETFRRENYMNFYYPPEFNKEKITW